MRLIKQNDQPLSAGPRKRRKGKFVEREAIDARGSFKASDPFYFSAYSTAAWA